MGYYSDSTVSLIFELLTIYHQIISISIFFQCFIHAHQIISNSLFFNSSSFLIRSYQIHYFSIPHPFSSDHIKFIIFQFLIRSHQIISNSLFFSSSSVLIRSYQIHYFSVPHQYKWNWTSFELIIKFTTIFFVWLIFQKLYNEFDFCR